MGVKIGDVDIANEIVDLRFRLFRVLLTLEKIIDLNSNLNVPNQQDLDTIEERALNMTRKRYPNMGVYQKSKWNCEK